jgi:hypothetical protein
LDPFVLQINFVHRFLGQLIVIAANVHGIGYGKFVPLHYAYISQKLFPSLPMGSGWKFCSAVEATLHRLGGRRPPLFGQHDVVLSYISTAKSVFNLYCSAHNWRNFGTSCGMYLYQSPYRSW